MSTSAPYTSCAGTGATGAGTPFPFAWCSHNSCTRANQVLMAAGVAGNACSMVTRSPHSVPAYVTVSVAALRAKIRRVPVASTLNTTLAGHSIQGPSSSAWWTPAGRAARSRAAVLSAAAGCGRVLLHCEAAVPMIACGWF